MYNKNKNSKSPNLVKSNAKNSTPTETEGLSEGKSAPRMVRSGDDSAASQVLNIEREARLAESEAELRFLMVNSTRKIVNYRQGFLLDLFHNNDISAIILRNICGSIWK